MRERGNPLSGQERCENYERANDIWNSASVEGIVSRPSPFSVEETLERLQEAIQSRKLSLFAQIDQYSDEWNEVRTIVHLWTQHHTINVGVEFVVPGYFTGILLKNKRACLVGR